MKYIWEDSELEVGILGKSCSLVRKGKRPMEIEVSMEELLDAIAKDPSIENIKRIKEWWYRRASQALRHEGKRTIK